MRFVIRDPKKGSSGSPSMPPARCGQETQYVLLHQQHFCLYVVFSHCCVAGRMVPENSASLIP